MTDCTQAGDAAPDFTLPAAGAERTRLEVAARRKVVIFCFPKPTHTRLHPRSNRFNRLRADLRRPELPFSVCPRTMSEPTKNSREEIRPLALPPPRILARHARGLRRLGREERTSWDENIWDHPDHRSDRYRRPGCAAGPT